MRILLVTKKVTKVSYEDLPQILISLKYMDHQYAKDVVLLLMVSNLLPLKSARSAMLFRQSDLRDRTRERISHLPTR